MIMSFDRRMILWITEILKTNLKWILAKTTATTKLFHLVNKVTVTCIVQTKGLLTVQNKQNVRLYK